MRRVQDLRKQSGLEKNDVIKLHIKSSLSLEGFEDRIKKTCGASELTISDEGSEFSIKTEFEILYILVQYKQNTQYSNHQYKHIAKQHPNYSLNQKDLKSQLGHQNHP